MAIYQIFIPILSLIFIAEAFSKFRQGRRRVKVFLVWIFFWVLIGAIAFFPKISYLIAKISGFEDNVNALIFISLGTLFYLLFRLLLYIETLDEKISQLVRSKALSELGFNGPNRSEKSKPQNTKS